MATLGQLERFCEKVAVDHDGPLTNGQPCWLWHGALFQETGYAAISRDNRTQTGHRWVWVAIHGRSAVVPGHVLDHLCRVRHCVNPAHLEQVTEQVNINRGEGNNKPRAECEEGHPLSGENLYVAPNGMRQCKKCRARRGREHRARKWEQMTEAEREAQRIIWRARNKARRAA